MDARHPSGAKAFSGRRGARRALAWACVPLILILVLAAGCTSKTSEKLTAQATPYMTLRYKNVVPQIYDFSCGAASLATLLNGVYGEHFNEAQLLSILRAVFDPATWKVKQKEGFSFAELAFVAEQVGYQAEGAEISFAELTKVKAPVIVQLTKNEGDFEHFTVFRGVENGVILLADPITGLTSYGPNQFAAEYTGFALAVWKEGTPIPKEYALIAGAKDRTSELRHFGNDLGVRVTAAGPNF